MAEEIKLPNLGDGIESGDVLSVFVSVGDVVKAEQGILELETDKATVEVPTPTAGTVTKTGKSTSAKTTQLDPDDFAFGRINYTIMIGGLLLIILGYALMAGGKSSTPEEFNPEIFSFQRITLAPLMVLAGLVVQVWAIVKKAD